jgi:hypothetical protein
MPSLASYLLRHGLLKPLVFLGHTWALFKTASGGFLLPMAESLKQK